MGTIIRTKFSSLKILYVRSIFSVNVFNPFEAKLKSQEHTTFLFKKKKERVSTLEKRVSTFERVSTLVLQILELYTEFN